MKELNLLLILLSFLNLPAISQDIDKEPSIGIYSGMINYEGDLKPNSFTFEHSNYFFGLTVRKPLNRWITWRSGFSMGSVEGADRYNRDYLKARNLSFYSRIMEGYTGLALTFLDISTTRFTPYIYGGIGVFHFDPWTYDNQNQKTRLKPLSTEGQGIIAGQKPYGLTQLMLPFGAGMKFALSDAVYLGVEFSQRKTFTDYLDDVSTHYVEQDILLQARGPKAVELAYRGDELPNGSGYPPAGEQRGTPHEMDWYYFLGVTLEVKFSSLQNIFHGNAGYGKFGSGQSRCPRF